MIHICFCLSDSTGLYSKFVGTTMFSLFENTNTPPLSVCVHILHDNTLTDDNKDKFIWLAGRYGQLVKFYNVEESCADRIEEINNLLPGAVKLRFTIGMYYRFFIPHVLPPEIEKVIYLDGDIIVNLPIEDLWQIDPEDKVMGVIATYSQKLNPSAKSDLYEFNSGVLLMNIPALRKEDENLKNSIKLVSEDVRYVGNDQEILNHCFDRKVLHIPVKFNRLVKWERWQKVTHIENKIYHYNGAESDRSFGLDLTDPFNRLWMSYFTKTPWFNAESIGRLWTEFEQRRGDLENYRLKVSMILPGKARAFFIEPSKVEKIKKIFAIRNDEEIILAENEGSIQKLIDAMKTAEGKKIFFIMPKVFLKKRFPLENITKEGFVHYKDFLKGWEILSEKNGGFFNTRPFVKAM